MANELLDAVFDTRAAISSSCARIADIADLLDEVGLSKLADRLFQVIAPLETVSKRLVDAHGEDLHDQLDHSSGMAGKLLLLALKSATEKGAA